MGNCCNNRHDEFDLISSEDNYNLISKNKLPELQNRLSLLSTIEKFSELSESRSRINQQILIKAYNLPESEISLGSIKKKKEVNIILKILCSQFAFSNFSEEVQQIILNKIKYIKIPSGQHICISEEPSYFLWVIQKGAVGLEKESQVLKILKKGDFFGPFCRGSYKFALTLEKTSFWVLDKRVLLNFVKGKNSDEYFENKKFLESAHIFSALSKNEKSKLLENFTIVKYLDNEVIVEEVQKGKLIFFIREGRVLCKSPGKFARFMYAGEYFGEMALLYKTNRACTVTAIGTVQCLVISKKDLKQILGPKSSQIVYKNPMKLALEKSPYFKDLKYSQLNSIIANMEILTFNSSQMIPSNNVKSLGLYIILKGTLKNQTQTFPPLSVLGNPRKLSLNPSANDQITAIDRVKLAYISKSVLTPIIFSVKNEKSTLQKALEKVYIFRSLSQQKLEIIKEKLKVFEAQADFQIFSQGSEGEEFFIVKSGKVGVYIDGSFVRYIEKSDYFGERSLLFNHKRSATIKAETVVQCWVLTKADFLQIIDERILSVLYSRIQLQDTNIELKDLIVVKKLGNGELGEVLLTRNVKTQQLYTLKTIDKSRVQSVEVQQNLIQERRILQELDHGFIPRLVKTFKDRKKIYFLLEYIQGEDLFDVIRKINVLKAKDCKFYSCCLLTILEYLHRRKIVYRDLKPENVMIDELGYPKLIDFGTAKILKSKTYTIIGTPFYMAPEVLAGKGYDEKVDYWSLGIMVYEFFYGEVPFGETETESLKVFDQIINGELNFPDEVKIKSHVKEFIKVLLDKDPEKRNIQIIKQHEWVKEIDWEALSDRKFWAPYLPEHCSLVWEKGRSKDIYNIEIDAYPFVSHSWDYEF